MPMGGEVPSPEGFLSPDMPGRIVRMSQFLRLAPATTNNCVQGLSFSQPLGAPDVDQIEPSAVTPQARRLVCPM